MQLNLYSSKGTKLNTKIQLDESVFNVKVNKHLLGLAVDVYQKGQRQSTAHTKKRGEVRGGGVKPWRQKGTGRARAGSIRSPIWKGGGVVFGPRTERNYKQKLSRKMRKGAIRSALSYFTKEKKLILLEGIEFKSDRLTKHVVEMTEKLPVGEKVLYIQKGDLKNLYLGCRNLKKVNVIPVNEIDVYTLLNHDYIIILKDALADMSKYWGEKKRGKKEEQVTSKVEKKTEIRKVGKKASVSVEDLGLSARVIGALKSSKILSKDQLIKAIKNDDKINGVGKKSLDEIRQILKIKK
ncbi:50S ribosomal protein L4 [Candidatus Dojkabacteria bacterium]|nr:50S ribosomal protein L4 [Candidatus Dojkabacteria bacterium]